MVNLHHAPKGAWPAYFLAWSINISLLTERGSLAYYGLNL